MLRKLYMTEHEMVVIADIFKKYFDACRVGKVAPPDAQVGIMQGILNKFKTALNPKEGTNDGDDRLHLIHDKPDKPTTN